MSITREPQLEDEVYPSHEEDSVPEHPEHEYLAWIVITTLRRRLRDKWVTGDVPMYWEQGNKRDYRAPDVMVVDDPARSVERGPYKLWADAPTLFVLEISSKSTHVSDQGPKVPDYLHDLKVGEYLYYDRLAWRMRLWKAPESKIIEHSTNAAGRMVSETLSLEFGPDDQGRLRVYERDGTVLPLPEELFEQAERAEQERRLREHAELRADAMQDQLEAEKRTAQQAVQRAEQLAAELERLREELRRRDLSGPATG